MEKFLLVYDSKKYNSIVICKCNVLGKDKWGNIIVKYYNGEHIVPSDNFIFDTLEQAQKHFEHYFRR